jgi:small subunit ribosomal protein S16
MLAIRLQRTGRSGHPEYRMIVQDSHRSPSSGKVVASLGNYNPHTKSVNINKEKAEFYVSNGAQPSPRVAKLLKEEGLKLPKWVEFAEKKTSPIKNLEKLRKNRPAEEVVPEETVAEAPTEDAEVVVEAEAPASEAPVVEEPVAEVVEAPAEETPPEEEPKEDK